MYDELVNDLHEISGNRAIPVHMAETVIEAADAIEELICEVADEHNTRLDAEERRRWIPVTERLPESGVPTLICGDGNIVEKGFFDDEYGYWYDWGGNRTFVHHWMPLPKPPKEK